MSTMSPEGRRELVAAVTERYQRSTPPERGRILDEFVALTGYRRKHAIRVLNGDLATPAVRRGRRSVYDGAVTEGLVVLWEASDRVCGKRLKALLPTLVPALERHGHLTLDPRVRRQLMTVSAATIDRRLASARAVTDAFAAHVRTLSSGRRAVSAGTCVFRPRLAVESWAALNAAIITELEADLPTRHLDDGRSAEEALAQERQHLRALPAHLPATCRIVPRVANKFGHVRVDRVTYSVPIRHAYRPVWVKLYHDRVAIAVGAEVIAEHPQAFVRGAKVLDALHVLPLLERKHRAVPEATALLDWRLAPVWQQARAELAKHTRKPDQEWVRMLQLMETHPAAAVEPAVRAALERHSPRLATVRLILRQQEAGPPPVCPPVTEMRPELARIAVPVPTLSAYDALVEGTR